MILDELMKALECVDEGQRREWLANLLDLSSPEGQRNREDLALRLGKPLAAVSPYLLHEAWQLLLALDAKEKARECSEVIYRAPGRR